MHVEEVTYSMAGAVEVVVAFFPKGDVSQSIELCTPGACGKIAIARSILPLSTVVKSCRCFSEGSPKMIVRVISVVPLRYWAPLSMSSKESGPMVASLSVVGS